MKINFRHLYIQGLAIAGIGLLGASFAPQAKASQWDKKTIVTLGAPMIAGDKVLEPGTYVWKLLDSPSDRHIVQIFDKDERHLKETILAIPNYRLQPTGNTRFAFYETPNGVPKAVRAWFYPGDNFGQEFKYPKVLIASLLSAVPVPTPVAYNQPEPTPAPQPVEAQPEPAPQPAAQPEPPPPAPQPQAETAPAAAPANSSQSLPHTASNVPVIGISGLLAVGLASALSLARKRA